HTRWPRDWSSDVCSSDLACCAARDQPVKDGFDLVGGGVAGGPQAVARERVAQLAQGVLGRPLRRRGIDDLGAEHLTAEARVGLRSEERRVGKGCGSRWGA